MYQGGVIKKAIKYCGGEEVKLTYCFSSLITQLTLFYPIWFAFIVSLNKSVTKAALFSAQLLATFSQDEHFFGV